MIAEQFSVQHFVSSVITSSNTASTHTREATIIVVVVFLVHARHTSIDCWICGSEIGTYCYLLIYQVSLFLSPINPTDEQHSLRARNRKSQSETRLCLCECVSVARWELYRLFLRRSNSVFHFLFLSSLPWFVQLLSYSLLMIKIIIIYNRNPTTTASSHTKLVVIVMYLWIILLSSSPLCSTISNVTGVERPQSLCVIVFMCVCE